MPTRKYLRAIVFLAVCLLSDSLVFAANKLTQIAENVYAYVDTKNSSKDNSFGANAGIVVGNDGIAVIDTLTTARQAKRFICDIRAISRKPIKYVINTHYHLDHSLGNCEFAKLGAVIIAQENDKKSMEATAQETIKNAASYGMTDKDIKGTVPVYPVISYGDRMAIDLNGQKIELIHSRHAHTDGDTLVYLRDKKLLFTGDVLFTNYHPFIGEGNIEEWLKELDEIKAMDIDIIIPGHGPVSSKKDLDSMKAYIQLFDREAKKLAASSNDVGKIVEEILKVLPQRPEGAWLVAANIQMKYVKNK